MNAHLQDLSAGYCIGLLDFTDRPQAMRYAICIQCPVRDLCPDRTLQPRQDVCVNGHLSNRYANGSCRVCKRDREQGTRTPPDVTLEALAELHTRRAQEEAAKRKAEQAANRSTRKKEDRSTYRPIQNTEGFMADLTRHLAAGLNADQIAAAMGYRSNYAIRRRLARLGRLDLYPYRTPKPPQRTRPYIPREDLIEAAETGASITELTQRFGLKASSILRALTRAGRHDLAAKIRPTRPRTGANQHTKGVA